MRMTVGQLRRIIRETVEEEMKDKDAKYDIKISRPKYGVIDIVVVPGSQFSLNDAQERAKAMARQALNPFINDFTNVSLDLGGRSTQILHFTPPEMNSRYTSDWKMVRNKTLGTDVGSFRVEKKKQAPQEAPQAPQGANKMYVS